MWQVYILKAANNYLYTGITNNLEKRLRQHKKGRGSRFTRAFGADKLLYTENYSTRSAALKREIQIKKLSRREKLALIKTIDRNGFGV